MAALAPWRSISRGLNRQDRQDAKSEFSCFGSSRTAPTGRSYDSRKNSDGGLGALAINFKRIESPGPPRRQVRIQLLRKQPDSTDGPQLRLQKKLRWRPWRPGDQFQED